MLNNQSTTPVETEEKQFSVKGLDNDSQEHSGANLVKLLLQPYSRFATIA
jgi:hypothetical protein